jgi:hypothetical protein
MWQCPVFLTGDYMAILGCIISAIGLYCGRLHGQKQRILLRAGQIFMVERKALINVFRQVLIDSKPVVITFVFIKDEFTIIPDRLVGRKLP